MLTISLLGPPEILLNGDPVIGFVSQKAPALLAYLTIEADRPHSRRALAGLLWPEKSEQTALKNLRDVILSLRKALDNRAAKPPYLQISRQSLQFNLQSAAQHDVGSFLSLTDAARHHKHRKPETCRWCAAKLQQAIELYRGDFLSGFFINDSSAFDDWQILQREHLRRIALDSLFQLTRYHERRQEYLQARNYAHRQVALDPWREEAHVQLMRLLALGGERSAALKQYQTCRRVLETELGVEPAEETTALYQQIRAGTFEPQSVPAGIHRTNLLAQPNRFFGRAAEISQIEELLQAPHTRLLTLVGPGGVGKTRLALQSAAEQRYNFEDGIYFVPLAALSSPLSLVPAIAGALHLQIQGQTSPKDRLVDFLRAKDMLLVLDNFEHFLCDDYVGVDLLIEIIKKAPSVILLITSREPVRLQSEVLIDLRGLPYANDNKLADETAPAIQLFLSRARRIRTDFSLEVSGLPQVAAICQLVEGLPLGIELAASWVRTLTCEQILADMTRSLDALQLARRDVPSRHRSLQAVCEHSWGLLSSEEQYAFRALSVFRGQFTPQAASAVIVAPDSPSPDGLPTSPAASAVIASAGAILISSLTNKSLLRRVPDSESYEMHEVLRQFAAEKLAEHPELQKDAKNQHAVWYAAFIHEREEALRGPHQQRVIEALRGEQANLRAAWQQIVETSNTQLANQAAPGLFQFYARQGWYAEGQEAFQRASNVFEHQYTLAWMLAYQGDFLIQLFLLAEAKKQLSKSLALADKLNDQKLTAFCICCLGKTEADLAHNEQAEAYFKQSLSLFIELDDLTGQAQCNNDLGTLTMRGGRFSEAREYWERSIRCHDQAGDIYGKSVVLNNLGILLRHLGEYESAASYLREALSTFETIQNERGMASACNNLGLVEETTGSYLQAEAYFKQGLDLCQKMGERKGSVHCLNNLGMLAISLEEYPRAHSLYQESYALSREINLRVSQASALHNLGMIAHKTQNYSQARKFYTQSLAIKDEIDDEAGTYHTCVEFGKLALQMKNRAEAKDMLRRAFMIARETQSPSMMLEALAVWVGRLQKTLAPRRRDEILQMVYRHPACSQDVKTQIAEYAPKISGAHSLDAQKPPTPQDLDDLIVEVLEEEC